MEGESRRVCRRRRCPFLEAGIRSAVIGGVEIEVGTGRMGPYSMGEMADSMECVIEAAVS